MTQAYKASADAASSAAEYAQQKYNGNAFFNDFHSLKYDNRINGWFFKFQW